MTENNISKKELNNKRLKNLISSREKKIDHLNKEKKAGKHYELTSVNVVCSQKDIERTIGKKR